MTVCVIFSVFHLPVESLNTREVLNINDFKLTVLSIISTNQALGSPSLTQSQLLCLHSCPLGVCPADKQHLLLREVSWIEKVEVTLGVQETLGQRKKMAGIK